MNLYSKKIIRNILKNAEIKINGPDDFDIQIKNNKFYGKVLLQGSMGLGESYMQGWWECKKLDEFFYKLLVSGAIENAGKSLPLLISFLKSKILNLQAVKRAFIVGQKHYDLGNDFFEAMLGKTMAYSCGYWKNAKTLDASQKNKYDLICKKINLQNGQQILDIGCGWGGFAKYAAENYKVSVTGVTVSKEQADFAKKLCKDFPVNIKLQDYRDISGKFDHIISIGMFEHVGQKNYKTFMKIVKNCLKENGLFLLHTIGSNKTSNATDPWINKYIFPNGSLPSLKQITKSVEDLFVVEDVHNFGADYDKTLMAWHKNFITNQKKFEKSYNLEFFKMWQYYLLSCAGAFRARNIQLWQIVLSQKGVKNGYKPVR